MIVIYGGERLLFASITMGFNESKDGFNGFDPCERTTYSNAW
jgi:hypothetical protein